MSEKKVQISSDKKKSAPNVIGGPVAGGAAPVRQGMLMLQHLVNHIGVAIASKLVPVASIFLYSHLMSVSDYGILNLASSYLWILGIIMTFNLHTGVGRYIYTGSADFSGFLGTTFVAIGLIYVTLSAIVLVNLGEFAKLMALPGKVIGLMLLIVLGAIAESMLTQIAIHRQSSTRLVRCIFIKAVSTLSFSVLLLYLIKDEKFVSVMYADAAVSVAFLAFVLFDLRKETHVGFHLKHLKYMSSYAIPLIPYMLCLTLLSQFDRVMIDRYFGKEVTGLYSLSYNVGVLMLMVVTALLNVFTPAFFTGVNQRRFDRVLSDSDGIFALGAFATMFLVLFGQDIFSRLVPTKYDSALDLIPVVGIGGLCLMVFQLWARLIAYVNKTYLLSIIATIATIIKIGLNMLLFPVFGYKIAAMTTVIAYLVMSLLCVWVVNTRIGMFKVGVAKHIGYMGICLFLWIFFATVTLYPWLSIALKLTVMALAVWHFKDKILDLLLARSAPVQ